MLPSLTDLRHNKGNGKNWTILTDNFAKLRANQDLRSLVLNSWKIRE